MKRNQTKTQAGARLSKLRIIALMALVWIVQPFVSTAQIYYSEDFESGSLGSEWTSSSSQPTGQIAVTNSMGTLSHGGDYHVIMHETSNSVFNLNYIDVKLSLSIYSRDKFLTFWWKEFSEETHAQDGVFISDDGVNYHKIYAMGSGAAEWTEAQIDLEKQAKQVGVSLQGEFHIRFQQYDNYSIPIDGIAIDDIVVRNKFTKMDFDIGQPGFNTALDFDGTKDFMLLPVDTLAETHDGFTVETWVKWRDVSSTHAIFYAGSDWSDFFMLDETGFTVIGTNYGHYAWKIPMNQTPDNNWHHVAVTVDVVNNEGKLYYDGRLSGSFPNNIVAQSNKSIPDNIWSFPDITDQLRKATIGRNQDATNYFDGELEEFRVWNYARSESQINEFKLLTLPHDEPGLIYYFNFDEGVASGDNQHIDYAIDQVAQTKSELLGFDKVGGSSNFIESSIPQKTNRPFINRISTNSAIAGNEITIYGANFSSNIDYNKVFIGGKEADITYPKLPYLFGVPYAIKAKVPDGISGLQELYVVNSEGASLPKDFFVISPKSQLDFSFTKDEVYSKLIGPVSLQPVDLNNDDYPEIIIGGQNELQLLTNNKDNTFTKSTITTGSVSYQYIKTADVDGDGDQDIICFESPNIILLRNNNLTWVKSTLLNNPELGIVHLGSTQQEAILFGDLDSDGDLDMVTRKELGFGWLANNGSGVFSAYQVIDDSKHYMGLALGDINGDLRVDIAAVESTTRDGVYETSPPLVFKFIGAGDGTFGEKIEVGQVRDYGDLLTIGELDEDGNNEIIYGGWNAPIYSFNGANPYLEKNIGYDIGQMSYIELVDLDGSGYNDLLITTHNKVEWRKQKRVCVDEFRGTCYQYNTSFSTLNITDGLFIGMEAKAVDLDNDGDLDVVSASKNDNRIVAYYHEYSGTDFSSYSLLDQVNSASIDKENHRIDVNVSNNAKVAKLFPDFTISEGAKITLDGFDQTSGASVVDFSDPGEVIYSITAENGDQQDWIVAVHPLPGVPFLNEAFDVTQYQAKLNWSNPTYCDSYSVEVSVDDFQTYETFTANSTSLEVATIPGTTYKARLKGINAYGESESYSNTITFQTIPSPTEITSVSDVGAAGAVLNWNAAIGASQYRLDVSRNEFFTSYVGGYESRGVASLSESVIGLDAGTNYWARIRSENSTGVSESSEVFTFITISEIPTLTATEVKQNQISVGWNLVTGATGYQIEHVTDTINYYYDYDAATQSATFESLAPAIQYKYRIRSNNASGYSDFSEMLTLKTIPGTPSGILISNIKQENVSIDWQNVSGANEYLLELSDDSFSTLLAGYNPKSTTSTTESVLNLTPGESYFVRVQSQNSTGASPYSETAEFYTLPATPVARDASVTTASSFNANWDAVSGDNITYTLEVADNPDFDPVHQTETVEGSLSFQLADLGVGISYWYRVKANNTSGSSHYSNIVFVEQPISINDLVFSETMSQSASTDLPITFSVTGGRNVHQVVLRHKGVLAANWNDETLSLVDGSYGFNVQKQHLDEVGLTFEIEVSDGFKTFTSDPQSISWADIDAEVPFKNIGEQWQMFSIPYVLDDDLIASVFDELAQYEYMSEWRLMHYDGSKYLDAGSGISKIELGKGYWLNSSQEAQISFNNADVNTADPFRIDLHAGWNQIGNPYNVNISWNNVRNSNGISATVDALVQFDEASQTFFDDDIMHPFDAGFVWADQATPVDISSTTNRSNGREIAEKPESHDIDALEWVLAFNLSNGLMNHEVAKIGMHPNAVEGKDGYDRVTLPRFYNYLEMYTFHGDFFHPWFSQDVVQTSNQNSWLFELESNFVHGQTTLNWDNDPLIGATKQLWLIDELTGRAINMSETNEFTFDFSGRRSFSIHLEPDNSSKPLPYSINLGNPFPNPTDGNAKIDVLLSQGQDIYQVDLGIFDIHGRRVATIADGVFNPGMHSFEIDFSDLESFKAGVYIYKLELPNTGLQPVYKKLIFKK